MTRPLWIAGRPMGANPELAARSRRACWQDGQGQSPICRSRTAPLPGRHSLARFAGAFRGFSCDTFPAHVLEQEQRVVAHFRGAGGRCRLNEYAMIDSTIVRAHQHGAGAKKGGRNRSDRAKPRRVEHENPCHRRCSGQSDRLSPSAGADA